MVTSEAVGAPEVLLAPDVAPIAPEPLLPDGSTPAKLITVREETTLCDSVTVTVTLLSGAAANARQISAVPLCTLVRTTRTQVSPAPETLWTVVFDPDR